MPENVKPAARITDRTAHGAKISTTETPSVTINGLPVAVLGDDHMGSNHEGPILSPKTSVVVGPSNRPIARVGDTLGCKCGCEDVIISGEPTVVIGETKILIGGTKVVSPKTECTTDRVLGIHVGYKDHGLLAIKSGHTWLSIHEGKNVTTYGLFPIAVHSLERDCVGQEVCGNMIFVPRSELEIDRADPATIDRLGQMIDEETRKHMTLDQRQPLERARSALEQARTSLDQGKPEAAHQRLEEAAAELALARDRKHYSSNVLVNVEKALDYLHENRPREPQGSKAAAKGAGMHGSRYYRLPEAAYIQVMKRIRTPSFYDAPPGTRQEEHVREDLIPSVSDLQCTTWALWVVEGVVTETLPDKEDWFGYITPRSLGRSLNQLEAAHPTSASNPVNLDGSPGR